LNPDVDHVAVLIDCSPEVVLLAVDSHPIRRFNECNVSSTLSYRRAGEFFPPFARQTGRIPL